MALPKNVLLPLRTVADLYAYLDLHRDDEEATRLRLLLLDKLQSLLDREAYRKEKGYQ